MELRTRTRTAVGLITRSSPWNSMDWIVQCFTSPPSRQRSMTL